jgi:ABC-2 type transport system permease protein
MQVLAIATRTLRSIVADRKNLMIMLLMPVVFSLVFGLLLGGSDSINIAKYQLGLYLPGTGAVSTALRQSLEDDPHILLTEVSNEQAARDLVQANQVVASVLLPNDFDQLVKDGQSPVVRLVRETDTNLFLAVQQELSQLFSHLTSAAVTANLTPGDDWQATFARALAAWQDQPITVTRHDVVQPQAGVPASTTIGLGFVIMFVVMGQSMAAGSILEEKGIGTWQRIIAAPVSRGKVLCGYILGYFVCGWLQFGILMLLEKLLFKATFGSGLPLVVLTSLLVFCSVAAGMAIAGVVKTYQQQQAVSAIALNVTSMLGGLFFPVEMFSPSMAKLAMITPQFWARKGYTELIMRGADWHALATPMLLLAAFSLVFFLVGLRGVRTE